MMSDDRVLLYGCPCAQSRCGPWTPQEVTIELAGFVDACGTGGWSGYPAIKSRIGLNLAAKVNGIHVMHQYLPWAPYSTCCVWLTTYDVSGCGVLSYTEDDCSGDHIEDDVNAIRIWMERRNDDVYDPDQVAFMILIRRDSPDESFYPAYTRVHSCDGQSDCSCCGGSELSKVIYCINNGTLTFCEGSHPGGCP